jgi:sugar (pentulose or hexulose) kinase
MHGSAVTSRHILVLDAGTSRARCYIFDERDQIVGTASRQWSYVTEDNAPSLARAFEPQQLWATFCHIIQECISKSHISPQSIAAVAVTSQRQGVVFLDEGDHEIYAGPNLDLRAVFEGAAIDEQMRDRVYQATGHLPSFFFAPAKLRWFQIHRPDAYARIACVLTLADWLVWKLTGEKVSETTLAGEAGFLDIRRRTWCTELMGELGLFASAPPTLPAGSTAGTITQESARVTGLWSGTPVAIAGADTQCGLLGLGISKPGEVGMIAGWSAPVQMVTAKPVLSQEGKTWAGCFLTNNRWVLESSPGDTGNAYQWLAYTLFGDDAGRFQMMDDMAKAVAPGSDGILAFLGHQHMDMTSLGMRPGGFFFPVPLTFSEMGRQHLARAALEAVAYALRANLEQIEEMAGAPASCIAVGGGMTRTVSFVRILADVLGREIVTAAAPDVSAIGAYLCARTALGEFASLDEAATSIRPSLSMVEPDPLGCAEYSDHYERWLQVSDQIKGLSL